MKINKTIFWIVCSAIAIAMASFVLPYLRTSESKNIDIIANVVDQPKKDIAIFFAGDAMFDRGIRYFSGQNGGNDFVFQKISDFLLKNDLNVVNLEGPITDNNSISINSKVAAPDNYIFTFNPSWAQTLWQHNILLVGIGNNHILNFESRGVESTKQYLLKAGVNYFGEPYGKRTVIKEIQGVKVGFVAYNEFLGGYTKEKNEVVSAIKNLKNQADIIFVFCHWGQEYQKDPSLVQKEFGKDFIDAGADAIFGAHPHVIQNMEEYKGKRIYYSLGNFIFDQYFSDDVRNGLGVIVKINPTTRDMQFEDKHFYLEKNGQTVLLGN